MTSRLLACVVLLLGFPGCGAEVPAPVAIVPGRDACASCRMVLASTSTAAQILVPGEEPRIFDDLACLRAGLRAGPLPAGTVVVVADHLDGAWVPLQAAILTEVPGLQTPMGSGLVAHGSDDHRRRDTAVREGRPVAAEQFAAGGTR